jgi:hypothetical protein
MVAPTPHSAEHAPPLAPSPTLQARLDPSFEGDDEDEDEEGDGHLDNGGADGNNGGGCEGPGGAAYDGRGACEGRAAFTRASFQEGNGGAAAAVEAADAAPALPMLAPQRGPTAMPLWGAPPTSMASGFSPRSLGL